MYMKKEQTKRRKKGKKKKKEEKRQFLRERKHNFYIFIISLIHTEGLESDSIPIASLADLLNFSHSADHDPLSFCQSKNSRLLVREMVTLRTESYIVFDQLNKQDAWEALPSIALFWDKTALVTRLNSGYRAMICSKFCWKPWSLE